MGQRLDVRLSARTVTIYDGEAVVARHVRQERGRATRLEHYPEVGQAFDFSYNPEISKARIGELASGRFIAEHAAVVLCGPTGVGKSFVAQALGVEACRQHHSVLFAKTSAFLSDLAGGAPTAATSRGCAAT